MVSTDERMRQMQNIAFDDIKKIGIVSRTEADIYMAGLVMGVAKFLMEHRGGRRKAYDYFQGFADDLVQPILER